MAQKTKLKHKIRKLSLKLKVSFFLIFFVALIGLIMGFFTITQIDKMARESLRKELMAIASSTAIVIDAKEHEMIQNPEDEDGEIYKKVQSILKKQVEANPGVSSIYTLRKSDKENIWLFAVDSQDVADVDNNGVIEPEEEKAHIGEEYDVSEFPEMQKAFNGPSADYKTTCDKWGCWLSGYAPIKDEQGRAVAIVGVDKSANDILAYERRTKEIVALLLSVIITVFFLLSYLLLRILTWPALKIAKEMQRFSQDFSTRIELKTGDEFELIASDFNKMATEFQDLYASLDKKVKIRTSELQKTREKLEKSYKKLKNADEMQKQFVSHTVHELRTPLNIFRWTVEMLKNEDVGPINLQQREFLNQIYQANQRLTVLVDDLLEVSRIDEKRFIIKMSLCQIEDLISEVMGEFAIMIREKKLKFLWQKPKEALPKIKGDCCRISQVLINIIGNAIKYTPEDGKIEIRIFETKEIAPKNIIQKFNLKQNHKNYICCSVKDSGIGIPKEEQNKMFSRFFRTSNAIKTTALGTGLGLFIVKQILDMHEGAVWFESEGEGKGTTFYFTLPVATT